MKYFYVLLCSLLFVCRTHCADMVIYKNKKDDPLLGQSGLPNDVTDYLIPFLTKQTILNLRGTHKGFEAAFTFKRSASQKSLGFKLTCNDNGYTDQRSQIIHKLLLTGKLDVHSNIILNYLNIEGFKLFCEATIHLTTLDLGYNHIRDEHSKPICDALVKNTALANLNLGDNYITDFGVKHICDALVNNTTLTSLNLGNNHIADSGVKYICDALVNNTTLIILNLILNTFGDDGAKYVFDLQKKNSNITIEL